ncbi:MAG: transglutaminase domain-containing protein [Isosphaeraceae bacterium]|nr:transglutaminase domain-containing protein [Isosphaeraceae bacterium]
MPRLGPVTRPLAWVAGALLSGLTWGLPARAEESWDAVYIAQKKVGHIHVKVEPVKDGAGRSLLRVVIHQELNFKRDKDQVALRQDYGTIETLQGSILRLDTRTYASQGGELRTFGDVIDGKMHLTLEKGGTRSQQVIPWGDDIRGPYGAELSLSRQPMKPYESRDVRTYIPDLNQVCITKLQARGIEPVELGQNTRRNLLRVEQTVTDANDKPIPGMKSTLWVDEGGQIIKSLTDLLGGMLTYRTTREAALTPDGDFNLLAASILKIAHRIPDPEKKREIRYRVTLANEDPTKVLPSDARQAVRRDKAPHAAILTVKTSAAHSGPLGPAAVGDEFLRPNPLIDSEDSRIRELARQAAGSRTDPWQKAVAIMQWVADNLKNKNFSVGFAPASEVARDLAGDCSEHSVLTAAMCRAEGIPARCVVGLVYGEQLGGFGPHMWNEVYINRRWVPLDAAFRQSEVDATHIKLAETSLDGVAPFEAFLPVLRVFDKMKIEAIEVR